MQNVLADCRSRSLARRFADRPRGRARPGNLVTVDGAPNQELFSHPEVVAARGARLLYFSTRAADGHLVVVTNAPAALPAYIPALSTAGACVWMAALLTAGLLLLRRRGPTPAPRTGAPGRAVPGAGRRPPG